MEEIKFYIPKGRMCMACKHKRIDCSGLDFHKMPELYRTPDCVVVKCTHFKSALEDDVPTRT